MKRNWLLLFLPLLWCGGGAFAQEAAPFTWDHYHRFGEITRWLQLMARRHSDLCSLTVIGKSRQGRPILALEINNKQTGPALDKPGFYIDGNIHGGEVLAGEAALYLVQEFLEGGSRSPAVKRLVDKTAIYIVPVVNPDGRVISISTPENHRWNARPLDEDGDGRLDEDPPEDLDGDGSIVRMRIPDPQGRYKISARDPRLMVRRGPKERGAGGFRLYQEGRDNDGDGRFNEDPVGGIDLNRNFPVNWSPTQFASGPFPLSEPETWALVKFITDRPNIAAIHTFHTSGGMILRFPTLAGQNWDFPPEDLRAYAEIGQAGARITGYANYARGKQTIVSLMHPGHGVFNDWASKVFGVLAVTTELWKHPFGSLVALRWNDDFLKGKGFVPWHAFSHPQLGRVELGGWKRWSRSNPPEELIASELKRNARWVLDFASRLPRLAIEEFRTEKLVDASKVRVFQLQARVANVGWMATDSAYAREILKSSRGVTVSLKLENATLLEGPAPAHLGSLPGKRKGSSGHQRSLTWLVKLKDPRQAGSALLQAVSVKAGRARRHLRFSLGTAQK